MLRRMMMASASTVSAQTVLSPVNKASDIILSNGGIDAESNMTMGGIVLSSSGKSSGKFYVECQYVQKGPANAFSFGLHSGTSSLSTYLGGDSSGWGSWVVNSARSTYHNAVESNLSTQTTPALNIKARMAVDLDLGMVWLAAFGSTSWLGGGDPALGTSPTYTFSPSGLYYFALSPYHGSPTTPSNRNKLRLVPPSNWLAGSPPSGFGIWT